MKFPRPTIKVGDCLAIWKRQIGHRKEAGPCLSGRKQIMYDGEPWKPSRLAYHLNIKSIPRTPRSMKRGLVLHTCDHEWCIEPTHLYRSTQRRNLLDKYARHPTIHMELSAAHIGLKHTAATRQKMSEVQNGHAVKNVTKRRIAEAQRAHWRSMSFAERQERMAKLTRARWGKP